MQRYFVSETARSEERQVIVRGSDHHHMLHVMRMQPGDVVAVVVGETPYLAKIAHFTEFEARLELVEEIHDQAEPQLMLTLLQGLPKGDKIELVIRQAVEIGVANIVVFTAERSVAQIKADKLEARLARFQKIAKESAELAQRERIPKVVYADSLAAALKQLPDGTRLLVPYERQDAALPSLKSAIREWSCPEHVAFTIGPEGGFADSEVAALEVAGGEFVTLGKRILRTETAGIVVATALLYEWDQMGVQ